jgi:ABC-2 type transport system ATP-binding protein
MTALLEARDLRKQFARVCAVDGVSFAVDEGRCFGLLGPNGAGKSTTIEMLEGLLRPSGGQVLFRGAPLDRRYRERIGIQFQSTALQDHLTVDENLRFFASLYARRTPLDRLIERCRLEEFLDRDSHKISGGQRQRLLLALALVNDPEVVFLDEPTTGLDPQARRNFWALVQDIKREGTTVVLTTHYMEEAYQLCDAIAIVDHGRIIAQGSPSELLSAHYNDAVLELPLAAVAPVAGRLPILQRGEIAELLTPDIDATILQLQAAGVPLAQLRIRARTLEDLFLALTGKELRA